MTGLIETYVVTLTNGNSTPEITVVNAEKIENTIYGSMGYYEKPLFTRYSETEKGLVVEISVTDENEGQYIDGKAEYYGIAYPIHWGRMTGGEKTVVGSEAAKGYVFIPADSLQHGEMQVVSIEVYDRNEETAEAQSTAKSQVFIAVDKIGPSLIGEYMAKTQMYVISAEEGTIPLLQYSIKVDDGAFGSYIDYTGPIPLEAGHTYTIKAKGTDKLANTAEKEFVVTTPANTSITEDTINFDDVTHVYTRAAHYYVIGSGKGKPWDVPSDSFEFIMNNAELGE